MASTWLPILQDAGNLSTVATQISCSWHWLSNGKHTSTVFQEAEVQTQLPPLISQYENINKIIRQILTLYKNNFKISVQTEKCLRKEIVDKHLSLIVDY